MRLGSDILIAVIILASIILYAGIRRSLHTKKPTNKKTDDAPSQKPEESFDIIQEKCQSQLDYLNNGLLAPNHYFTDSEKNQLKEDTSELMKELSDLKNRNILEKVGEEAVTLSSALSTIESLRQEHNKKFTSEELIKQQEFFDTALDYPLDTQQRNSIVKLEDNCLVISSAGSGKTSTMIGKLLYLVHQRNVKPNRILTITYTHKASEELTQRLLGTGLSCMTFHKLAMNIVARVENAKPSIADNNLFTKVFYNSLESPEFREAILNYLTDYKSLVKSEHEYQDAAEYYRDRKKNGITALYTDMDGKVINTKSEEEKKICSYLTELGVSFKYEEPYIFETLTEEYRQYKPDFTIYYKDKDGNEKTLYLEHYALNSTGQVPKWFGKTDINGWYGANQKYHEGIIWKEKLHQEHQTKLIHTTSADFHNGNIRRRLRELLEMAGVPINEPTKDELIEKIFTRNKNLENALMQMTQSFIYLVKANGKDLSQIRDTAKSNLATRNVYVIDHIIKPLWEGYQKELSDRKEMDFTDVIIKATRYCNEGKWDQKYEYILVDEFQDISVDRYKFLQSLRSDMPHTKLYCVGDDWQSIYRFTGSDLSLFSEFSKYFGYTEECKIETTYRFGNPLIEKSSEFVQQNPLQKKKSVHARTDNPPETKLSFVSYRNNQELQSKIARMVERVPADKSVYIISRYSYDVKSISSEFKMEFNPNDGSVALAISGRKVKFMTIHSSKGLEADYVFMINCNSGLYGFPSLVSDDPILDYVLSAPEHYEYAEERRVFYVGITRAKVHTVVLYNSETPSPFVCEMNVAAASNLDPCPWCKVGHRILKYEGLTKQKTPYKVWTCDNREANCQYYKREFHNSGYVRFQRRRYIPR
ncbi:MAG: UvrD-helicase domain-containing protein [Bacteroidaceae bacterium]|nr:UvrD-helicase domain-containing protein [Bacteroidaceae bacterium]